MDDLSAFSESRASGGVEEFAALSRDDPVVASGRVVAVKGVQGDNGEKRRLLVSLGVALSAAESLEDIEGDGLGMSDSNIKVLGGPAIADSNIELLRASVTRVC